MNAVVTRRARYRCVGTRAITALAPTPLPPADAASGDTIFYDSAAWTVVDDGAVALGNDDDGWGRRGARWGAFLSNTTGAGLTVYATHWCVTARRPDDACDVERQLAYVATLMAHVDGAPRTIVAGDFNVFDGYADGPVIAALRDHGLQDAVVAADAPAVDTWQGTDWAPPGRIDYVFASDDLRVDAAGTDVSVDRTVGSDHYPVWANLRTESR